jgi:hypothetical protein
MTRWMLEFGEVLRVISGNQRQGAALIKLGLSKTAQTSSTPCVFWRLMRHGREDELDRSAVDEGETRFPFAVVSGRACGRENRRVASTRPGAAC